MAKNNEIEESQQSREGKAIGSSGNQSGSMTTGAKGPNHQQDEKGDIRIPNQERYSEKQEGRKSEGGEA